MKFVPLDKLRPGMTCIIIYHEDNKEYIKGIIRIDEYNIDPFRVDFTTISDYKEKPFWDKLYSKDFFDNDATYGKKESGLFWGLRLAI